MAAYGPKALALAGEVGDGFILQLADPDITAWSIERCGTPPSGPAATRTRSRSASPPPPTCGDDVAHMRDQCRWFGGMVGNHVADIVSRYGDGGGTVPHGADRLHQGPRRATTTTSTAAAGNTHAEFVPDEIVDRFCILGPPAEHIARLEQLAGLGVDQFAVYLQHDGKLQTLEAYGEKVIPAVASQITAKR